MEDSSPPQRAGHSGRLLPHVKETARCGWKKAEIRWLCEAAHVPVIWAPQILEMLAKTGPPSRTEVADAVASGNAECAMLNKGPHTTQAVRFLCDVLDRVGSNHEKKQQPTLPRRQIGIRV